MYTHTLALGSIVLKKPNIRSNTGKNQSPHLGEPGMNITGFTASPALTDACLLCKFVCSFWSSQSWTHPLLPISPAPPFLLFTETKLKTFCSLCKSFVSVPNSGALLCFSVCSDIRLSSEQTCLILSAPWHSSSFRILVSPWVFIQQSETL